MLLAVVPVQALEFGIDGSLASSALVDDWGVATHLQVIGSNHLGVDLGYRYFNTLSYNALSTGLSHAFSQFELGLLWQGGDQGIRVQAQAGAVVSDRWVQSNGVDVISRFQPGYQVGLGLSVPIFTRFRAFVDGGYQDWLDAEMPGHSRWRYGLRLTLGGAGGQALAAEEAASAQQEADRQQALIDNPPVIIDTAVPEYLPGHLSESLPPILSLADLCKCFPAGPFTLQLGEFGNMPQAVRGLEYRGLRQFFNSRAYQKAPLPVFLAQASAEMPVSLYLGELTTLAQLQYWHHELKKSGLSARFRKILGSKGERAVNPIVAMDDQLVLGNPVYTAEQIRRMNSLPDDVDSVDSEWARQQSGAQPAVDAAATAAQRSLLNQTPAQLAYMPDTLLQIGPINQSRLAALLSVPAMREVLARTTSIRIPQQMALVWDEGKQEAWLNFDRFADEQQVDEWRAWLDSEGLLARRLSTAYQPMGDVYEFHLGQALQEYSIEIDRHDAFDKMLQSMRSPEILWFQAYQRINDQPIHTSLNWSMADRRYHLIVTNVQTSQERQTIWSDLTAVGLLPSLAEE
ncbi:hypothetical protein [Reinekea sp.]|jgi:hypothetical protein|uniref:hypothetical protein n=1 Tax=Reinekea sp. TaxID=1970455 RepID=UPI002A7F4B5B|nr:hypothetical protein [Reinekea sp.]